VGGGGGEKIKNICRQTSVLRKKKGRDSPLQGECPSFWVDTAKKIWEGLQSKLSRFGRRHGPKSGGAGGRGFKEGEEKVLADLGANEK